MTGSMLHRWFGKGWLAMGFVFLYLPIVALVLYSFNDSPVPNAWRGFTLKWYVALAADDEMITAFGLSMRIAFFTACSSVLLGTLAAFALVKYARFAGRTLFSGMVNAPLVMPEVIIGLSLLLMLVSVQRALGFPERGALTIWMGHLLLGMAYATVVIQARLLELNPQLEEAAMDLGARPWKVFCVITLPLIAPALAAGWLLSFTLSFDDLIVTSFTSGPGASTLPMVIYSSVRLGVSPQINALATIMISVVAAFVAVSGWLLYRQDKAKRA